MWTKRGNSSSIPSPSKKTLKVLTIGNSFSVDSNEFLFDIAKSLGVDIVVGTAYDSGGGLESHWNKLQTDGTITAYNKWVPGTGFISQPNALVKNIVVDEDWDIILYQQVSADSGNYATFQPYLSDIHGYVSEVSLNTEVKFGFNMTWAYSSVLTSSYGNQEQMHNAIVEAYQQAMEAMDFDILVPTGTAIQNARTNTRLQAVNIDLTRDHTHLDMGIGRYIAALTFYETLFSSYYNKSISTHNIYVPEVHDANKHLGYLSRLAAKHATLNPLNTTTI